MLHQHHLSALSDDAPLHLQRNDCVVLTTLSLPPPPFPLLPLNFPFAVSVWQSELFTNTVLLFLPTLCFWVCSLLPKVEHPFCFVFSLFCFLSGFLSSVWHVRYMCSNKIPASQRTVLPIHLGTDATVYMAIEFTSWKPKSRTERAPVWSLQPGCWCCRFRSSAHWKPSRCSTNVALRLRSHRTFLNKYFLFGNWTERLLHNHSTVITCGHTDAESMQSLSAVCVPPPFTLPPPPPAPLIYHSFRGHSMMSHMLSAWIRRESVCVCACVYVPDKRALVLTISFG